METVQEKMHYGNTIEYPQLKRLPKAVYLVKQRSYAGQKECGGKYAAFTKNGRLITVNAGNNQRDARRKALQVLNGDLRELKLVYGSLATNEKYNEIIS